MTNRAIPNLFRKHALKSNLIYVFLFCMIVLLLNTAGSVTITYVNEVLILF